MEQQRSEGLRARIAGSAWAGLAGKVALYALGFAALALIGSGRVFADGTGAPSTGANRPTGSSTPTSASSASPSAPGSVVATASAPPLKGADDADAGAEVKGVTADGKVVLNHATEADFRRLPGIGPTRARAILALRAKQGGKFKRVEDLLRVRGLGRKTLARLRPLVVLDAPPPAPPT